jgi:hypothetical protein
MSQYLRASLSYFSASKQTIYEQQRRNSTVKGGWLVWARGQPFQNGVTGLPEELEVEEE